MVQPRMTQIDTVVFLMMENRSLDNVLGWLYDGSSKDYDGLRANTYFQPLKDGSITNQYPVVPIPASVGSDYRSVVPYYDPTEAMYSDASWSGVLNQLFGGVDMIGGMPRSGTPVTMQGFLQDYYRDGRDSWNGQDILWTFTPRDLPAINTLARRYGVSDAWFCSVPTQTNPNRAFSLIGTSQGRENDSWDAVERYHGPTIFNALGTAGKSWGLYFQDTWQGSKSFTEYTFPYMTSRPSGNHVIGSHRDFYMAVQSGNLPNFTYLEPQWGWGTGIGVHQGTDYHPPTDVRYAEHFLKQVYAALRRSSQWDRMLFIVTFDEHGGTYDHVKPQWGMPRPDHHQGYQGFNFDIYGARVPTLLISPYVAAETVFRAPRGGYPYDHTSFIKTLLLWAGVDPQLPTLGFGNRMPLAPTFDHVLSPTPVNTEEVEIEPIPCEEGETLNAMFEGVGFASIRKIMRDSRTLEEAQAEVARYRADPAAFEAALSAEFRPPKR